MKRYLLPALVPAILALPLLAADEDVTKMSAADFIKKFDANGDGFLQPEEMGKYAAAFEKLDSNKDKKIDEREIGRLLFFLKQQEAKAATLVNRAVGALDRNKDGAIDEKEARANPFFSKNFKQIDIDKDGKLSKEELLLAAKGETPTQVATNDPPQPGPGGRPRPGPGGRPMPPQPVGKPPLPKEFPFFNGLDKDFDGMVAQSELQGTPLFFYFAEMDTNKDGKVDSKEYAAFIEKAGK